jgi:hypothetical protein
MQLLLHLLGVEIAARVLAFGGLQVAAAWPCISSMDL